MSAAPDPATSFARLPERAEQIGVSLSAEQAGVLLRHYRLVLARNESMNLTRITDPEEAVLKLYLASLAVIPGLARVGVMVEGFFCGLDLGSGAGFPGIPLAVACPHLDLTLVDARRKKTDFLAEVVSKLDLPNVSCLHGRGSELARTRSELSGRFDLVTSRAVASAATTIEEAAHFLQPGGILVIYKGPELGSDEIAAGNRAAEKKGLALRSALTLSVNGLSPRFLIYGAWSSRDEGLFHD